MSGRVMYDPDLGRRVADNYFFWQGLRLVPFGVMILGAIAVPLAFPSWFPEGDWFPPVYALLWFVGAYWLMRRIGRYYHRTLGRAGPRPGAHRRRTQLKWLVAYPVLGLAPLLDAATDLPILVSPIVLAATMIAYWASTGRGRNHYLIVATAFASLFALPLIGVDTVRVQAAVVFTIIGVSFIAAGLLDHRELTRLMEPVHE